MSLGKDLAALRNKLGLSLEEIQGQIKIPTDVLLSIENESIFEEIESNKTYTRSFVRSYAKALKLDDDLIVEALDSIEAGIYTPGSILEEELARKTIPLIKPDVLDEAEPEESEPVLKKPDIEEAPPKPAPTVENVNWADMGKRFNSPAAGQKIVLPVVIALVIVGAAVTIFIFREPIFALFTSSESDSIENVDDTQNQPLISDDETETGEELLSEGEENAGTETPLLQNPEQQISENIAPTNFSTTIADTLTVTVYAAFDKLEPVRVTSDFNWRTNPFWMEQGEAFNFNFVDTLLVRGQYSRMLLLFNGHVIENPFQDYYDDAFDSIMLTRGMLNNEVYFAQPPSEFPYEIGAPDSLVFPLSN